MAERPELTPEQKAKPYSKYYYLPIGPLNDKYAELVKSPKFYDPSKALPIERLNDLLNPGHFEVEDGIFLLENGGAHVALDIMLPGVTGEMVYWFFAWYSLEDMRYKIWWPTGHFGISLSDEDRAKVLDPNRPLDLKVQGITHLPIEDVGKGPCLVPMSFMTPEDLGFDMSRFKPPAVAAVVGGNVSVPTQGDMPIDVLPVVDMGFFRDVPGGVEWRGRFFMGYHIIDRKPKFMLPPGVKVPASIPTGLFRHLSEEMFHLATFLPQLYKEFGGKLT